jgi:putative oxidoreductase
MKYASGVRWLSGSFKGADMNINTIAMTWSPRLLSVLRIVTALLLVQHGTGKLFSFPSAGAPRNLNLFSLIGLAGTLEVVFGTLVLIGLFTRPAAFILSGEMAFAYFIGHAPKSFFPLLNGGELAILFCFNFLYLSVAGAGPWSIDAMRNTRAP